MNAADAISLTQTAEGAIEEVTDVVAECVELSVKQLTVCTQDKTARQFKMKWALCKKNSTAIARLHLMSTMLNGSFIDTTFQVGFQPNDTATLSIEDVKPTGLGEFVLKSHVVDSGNMIPTETTANIYYIK